MQAPIFNTAGRLGAQHFLLKTLGVKKKCDTIGNSSEPRKMETFISEYNSELTKELEEVKKAKIWGEDAAGDPYTFVGTLIATGSVEEAKIKVEIPFLTQ